MYLLDDIPHASLEKEAADLSATALPSMKNPLVASFKVGSGRNILKRQNQSVWIVSSSTSANDEFDTFKIEC